MLLMDAEISVVDGSIIEMLKEMARDNPKLRARASLGYTDNAVQEMVIVMGQESYVRPHRHPRNKAESYHLMEGELLVKVFREDGTLYKEIKMNKKTPFYRLKGGWYHQPVPLSEWVVYHEVYPGPFVKETDVQYASWAQAE